MEYPKYSQLAADLLRPIRGLAAAAVHRQAHGHDADRREASVTGTARTSGDTRDPGRPAVDGDKDEAAIRTSGKTRGPGSTSAIRTCWTPKSMTWPSTRTGTPIREITARRPGDEPFQQPVDGRHHDFGYGTIRSRLATGAQKANPCLRPTLATIIPAIQAITAMITKLSIRSRLASSANSSAATTPTTPSQRPAEGPVVAGTDRITCNIAAAR